MSFDNIETKVISHLNNNNITAYGVAPKEHKYPFATVELVGRSSLSNHFLERRSLSITTWAATFGAAAELMQQVEDAMESFDDPYITDVAQGSLFRFPSTDGIPRYQTSYDFTINNK